MTQRVDSLQRVGALRLVLPVTMALACLTSVVFAVPAAAAKTTGVTVKAPAAKTHFSLDSNLAPFAPPLLDQAKFSFTAPGRAAATARLQTVERAFRFTPSGQPDNRKALTIGVSSRLVTASADTTRAAAETSATLPTAYNVDLAVGWKGFAINSGYSRSDSGTVSLVPLGRKEAVDVGLSYRGKNWRTSLQATAEQGSTLLLSPLERRYSVEASGAYAFGPRLSVTGGVRYKLAPEAPTLLDPDAADKAVYFGTNFAF